ncbi:hypothetical protein SteCoe_23944 [Stentor coeruleus]|uniref:Uncharacterized protein n=1 Tax=Stentor coeruleus TaxID=5963 RepID=A0A1R2BIP0_9CILI|nr:hypothetical protein SteCoe_23944 [Stentor coeruleus]
MSDKENPRLQKRLDKLKAAHGKFESPLIEDDQSDLSKSGYASEKSLYEAYSSYSPRSRPVYGSSEWVSYEQESITPVANDLNINQIYLSKMTQIQESLYAEIETLKNDKKTLSNENIQLRAKIQDLEKQIDSQIDKLQKKDKELNKLIFDKDLFLKAEDDLKRMAEDIRKKYEFASKENSEIKQAIELLKHEKREILKNAREVENKNESMQKTLKSKEEDIKSLQQTLNELESSTSKFKGTSSQKLGTKTSKLHVKKLDIPEIRGISESPERKKPLQLSDRTDEILYKNLYLEAKMLLSAENSTDFYEKIVKVKDIYAKYNKLKKFIDKLSDMIVQCSPSGSFNREPSTHQIWKWLTRLLEEYMKLKQSTSGESYAKLCQILNTESVEEMIEKVAHLQNTRSRGALRNP